MYVRGGQRERIVVFYDTLACSSRHVRSMLLLDINHLMQPGLLLPLVKLTILCDGSIA